MGKAECRFYSNLSLGWVYPRIRRRMQLSTFSWVWVSSTKEVKENGEKEIKRINIRDNFCISTEWFQEPDGRIISPLLFFLWSTYWQFSLSDHVKRPSRFHRSMFFLTWKMWRFLERKKLSSSSIVNVRLIIVRLLMTGDHSLSLAIGLIPGTILSSCADNLFHLLHCHSVSFIALAIPVISMAIPCTTYGIPFFLHGHPVDFIFIP